MPKIKKNSIDGSSTTVQKPYSSNQNISHPSLLSKWFLVCKFKENTNITKFMPYWGQRTQFQFNIIIFITWICIAILLFFNSLTILYNIAIFFFHYMDMDNTCPYSSVHTISRSFFRAIDFIFFFCFIFSIHNCL